MKRLLWVSFVLSSQLLAQNAIPAGTILPVQLNSTLRYCKARVGQQVSARVMQNVPLPGGKKVRAGATVVGHVVSTTPSDGTDTKLSLRFDALRVGRESVPVTTNLRAMASMMEVSEAQVPETGPDHGTSEYIWTTKQIGGEVDHRGGFVITRGSQIVGHSVADGVLVRLTSRPGTACRGAVNGNEQPQALWVFSSDACGLYGFPDATLTHAGRTDPTGVITIRSNKRDLVIRAGSGMLLRVN